MKKKKKKENLKIHPQSHTSPTRTHLLILVILSKGSIPCCLSIQICEPMGVILIQVTTSQIENLAFSNPSPRSHDLVLLLLPFRQVLPLSLCNFELLNLLPLPS